MTSLAYLCTPTDLHLIPKDAHDAALANYKEFSKKPFCMLMKLLAGKKVLRKNVRDPVSGEGGDFYYVNGISVAQGPNYGKWHWSGNRSSLLSSAANLTSPLLSRPSSFGETDATLACHNCPYESSMYCVIEYSTIHINSIGRS